VSNIEIAVYSIEIIANNDFTIGLQGSAKYPAV
jgi:hypothetical protein